MARNTNVITDRAFIKFDVPNLLRIEVVKTQRAYQIGEATGLFRVPRLLNYDPQAGRAEFEKLDGLRNTDYVLGFGQYSEALVERMARCLAEIHRQLVLPADCVYPLPAKLQLADQDEVFLHGDFHTGNICLGEAGDQMVVLDWQVTCDVGQPATCGTRFFDVVFFMACLFCRPLDRFVFSKPAHRLARRFLSSYLEAAGCRIDLPVLAGYMKTIYRWLCHSERTAPWGQRLRMAPRLTWLLAFLSSFARDINHDVGLP